MKVVVPMPLPNKANTYGIRFDPRFWKMIKGLATSFRARFKSSPYWIGPSEEVKAIEEAIAYWTLRSIFEDTEAPVKVEIWISNRLDADAVKACLDGIQKSGRIKNDKQVEVLTIYKLPIKNTEFSFDVTLIE
jgi:hypothetical protein